VKSIGWKVLACLLLLAGSAAGQKVTLPAEVRTEAGRLASVAISYDGDDVKYTVPPELDAFREYDPDERVIRLRVIGYKDGEHRIVAVTCKDKKLSEFAVCVVKVGKAPPPGPDPEPEPDPEPADPLTKELQAAYAAEADAAKFGLKASLAAFYRQSAELAKSDRGLTTWGQLFSVMKAAAASLGVAGKLPGVQKAVAGVLAKELPADGLKPLDDAGRAAAEKTFRRVAGCLEGVK
jgi:hypothetical protein